MGADSTQEVTGLLQRRSGGDADALEELTPLIYAEQIESANPSRQAANCNQTRQAGLCSGNGTLSVD